MASFNTHLVGGIVVGISSSILSLTSLDLTGFQLFSIFVMGILGGIIPDLDSDSGKPIALLSGTLSVIIPALLLNKMNTFGSYNTPEFLISYFILSYLLINYVIFGLIKKMTVHRGIIHSIPFALLVAELTYLMFSSSGHEIAVMSAISMFLGCLIHFVLDELNSIHLKYGFIPTLKKSAGTALKLYSNNVWANLMIYSLLILSSVFVIFRFITKLRT